MTDIVSASSRQPGTLPLVCPGAQAAPGDIPLISVSPGLQDTVPQATQRCGHRVPSGYHRVAVGPASSAWAGWEQEGGPGTTEPWSWNLTLHPVRCGNQLGTSLHQNGSLLLCAAAAAGIPG